MPRAPSVAGEVTRGAGFEASDAVHTFEHVSLGRRTGGPVRGFVTILFGFIYFKIDDYLIARSDSMITTQVNFFAALPPDRRIAALDDHLGQDRGVRFAGIFDAKGNRLAGNVARLPDDLGAGAGVKSVRTGADRRQRERRSIGESRRAEP